MIERVQREQGVAPFGRGEQRGEEAVRIVLAHQRGERSSMAREVARIAGTQA